LGVKDAEPAWVRAFIAVTLPAEVRVAVERVQRELKAAVRGNAVRWTPSEQVHLTLKFLGNVAADSLPDLESAVRHACADAAPFELTAGGLGAFPSEQRPRVLWVGVGGEVEALRQLEQAVARETAAWGEREDKPFHPHLTLGRVKTTRLRELRELSHGWLTVKASHLGGWRVSRWR
jgi:2'-5' RNA ligase